MVHPERPAASAKRRTRQRWLFAALALAALLATLAWLGSGRGRPAVAGSAVVVAPAGRPQFFGPIPDAFGTPQPAGLAGRRELLAERLTLAEQTYCGYRQASKYPHGARPIGEQPDQVYPNAAVSATHDMRLDGGGIDPQVRIETSQSRVFLAAGEGVTFTLRAIDGEGKPLALVVTRAVAQGLTFTGKRPGAQVALAFADDGKGADPVAADGAFAALLAPAQTGLASFDGTIRSEVRYSVAGRAGTVSFDVIYSPELPATWTGQVREAVESGTLNFYLKAEMRQAGRYIVSGRVDDARGQPVALLTFNELLGVGANEVRLSMFGKLLRDQEPALPLTLRDVDGYLLRENAEPDRALMPRLEGPAYVSKSYPLTTFSDAEWDSEERTRYLAEFGKDLAQAKAALSELDPDRAPLQGACVNPPEDATAGAIGKRTAGERSSTYPSSTGSTK